MSKRHDIPINLPDWLNQVNQLRKEEDVLHLREASTLYEANDLLQKALGIADILLELGLDTETLTAALLYPALQSHELTFDAIAEKFSEGISRLLHDALQMQSLGKLQHLEKRNGVQLENLRKMLLAMVTDVRAVLIVLAERLWQLRKAKHMTEEERVKLAQETLHVHAPLANRLGIWQLKWEIEDLCTRYLEPEVYSNIAKWLAVKREEREAYINNVIEQLSLLLKQAGIKNASVNGRVKHIYSIHRKMQRKQVGIEEIYDISAMRVLVDTIEDCYAVLGLLQNAWPQVQEEFDDYIALPKPNGYRSIHTVVIGPENKLIEIQIRTRQMHHESELGMAAHWLYKEGVLQTSSYESKIALLRQIMAWQKEMADDTAKKIGKPLQDIFADRVYVFTPQGDIIDLPTTATPLDFAYAIHSEVGNRCRGAKVNGNMVPLTYQLQTGDRVEILTMKEASPSRDWVNPHYGYLNTARARSKVLHWFRMKDSLQPQLEPVKDVKEKELPKEQPTTLISQPISSKPFLEKDSHHSNIQILGINNLLTNTARCCKPLPGDAILGYITRARGISIHKRDCKNISYITKNFSNRLIEVEWRTKSTGSYSIDLKLKASDSQALMRDVTTLLAHEKIHVISLRSETASFTGEGNVYLTIEVIDVQQLNRAMELLKKAPNLIEITRL